jgi:RNA polymerase sigma-70 factor (ECF subfamily)
MSVSSTPSTSPSSATPSSSFPQPAAELCDSHPAPSHPVPGSSKIESNQAENGAGENGGASPDLDLLQRCRDGDLEAFDELVAHHQNRIYNLCFWRLGDADEAADAAQDTFVRAWKSIAQFRGESAFSTWLHRIALNVTHDAASRRSRAPVAFSSLAPPGADEPDYAPDPHDPAEGPEQNAARRERRQAVRHALAQLPDHFRVVLILFDIEGRSYEEAAALLELPLGTLKSRLNRARLALRGKLEEQRELFED